MTTATLPRVTAILRRAGLVVPQPGWTDEARERGTALHAATVYLEEGTLDWDSVDPLIIGRLRSYQRYLDEVQPRTEAVEEEVTNEPFGYAGRLDRRVYIGFREGILDIKPPTMEPSYPLQVAMYAACFPRPMARWTLHLSDTGYKLVEHKDRRDWEVCKAALVLAAWKEQHGVE